MDWIDRFLANMDVGVGAFTSCDIRRGHHLTFAACHTASLHYCLAGHGTLHLRSGPEVALRQHSLVLVPPNVVYTISASQHAQTNGVPHRRLVAPPFRESVPTLQAGEGKKGILTACGEVMVNAAFAANLFAHLDDPVVEHFDGPAGLRDPFVILLAESARPGVGTRALTEALLKQCLVLLFRRQIARSSQSIARGGPLMPWIAGLNQPGLARALQAILEHCSDPFTVESLASIARMSRSAFAAHFMRAVGRSPMSLLRSVRLRRARELLVTTDATVDQVAHSVGLSSRSNFSRAFRATYGIDPTHFRAASLGLHSQKTAAHK